MPSSRSILVLLLTAAPAFAEPPADQPRPRRPDVFFVPSPQDVVEKMLDMAAVKKDDVVCDLGCGDGRIVVTAATKYGCRGVGYDLNPKCVKLSQDAVAKAGIEKMVRIENKDIFTVDLSEVTVATLFLSPAINAKLAPQFAKMKSGSRIVSHAFTMPGYAPDKTITVKSADDGISRKLYLWTTPLRKEP